MASRKERVSLRGAIRGQGHEADCTVTATRVTVPGLPPAYARFSVVKVAKVLPEGTYTLTVNGETHNVRHVNGNWLAAL